MTIYYTPMQVIYAAASAYCSSASGDNDDYVISKSKIFLSRCLSYDDNDGTRPISKVAIDNTAYAMLDTDCEEVLQNALKAMQTSNSLQNTRAYKQLGDKLFET